MLNNKMKLLIVPFLQTNSIENMFLMTLVTETIAMKFIKICFVQLRKQFECFVISKSR